MKKELFRCREREGFSLVEMIVTIALMAILIGLASLSISLLSASDTKALASHINDSLSELKSVNESNDGIYFLHIYKSSDGFFAKIDENGHYGVPTNNDGATRLGAANLKVEAVFAAGSSSEITGTSNILLGVKKKDGSFWNPDGATAGHPVVKKIEISDGGDTEHTVTIAKDTGLHYLD